MCVEAQAQDIPTWWLSTSSCECFTTAELTSSRPGTKNATSEAAVPPRMCTTEPCAPGRQAGRQARGAARRAAQRRWGGALQGKCSFPHKASACRLRCKRPACLWRGGRRRGGLAARPRSNPCTQAARSPPPCLILLPAQLTRFVTHIAMPSTADMNSAVKTLDAHGLAGPVPKSRYSKLARAGKWLIGMWFRTTTPMHARATCTARHSARSGDERGGKLCYNIHARRHAHRDACGCMHPPMPLANTGAESAPEPPRCPAAGC